MAQTSSVWKYLNRLRLSISTRVSSGFFLCSIIVGSAWSFVFFIPATTANDLRLRRIFYPRFYPLHLFFYLNSWERASIFPFECSVLNKGTTGTIFITSLVWRGPWLGIEPGTSRTRCQHYTTMLSRRRYSVLSNVLFYIEIHKFCNGDINYSHDMLLTSD